VSEAHIRFVETVERDIMHERHWPHKRYAAACAVDQWAGHVPRAINLHEWMEKWLPGLERDSRRIVVFMTPINAGATVEHGRLREDLEEELRSKHL
jgi:hypothetical protein